MYWDASRFVHLLEIAIKLAIKQIGHGLFTFPTEIPSLSWKVNPWSCNEQLHESLRMKKLLKLWNSWKRSFSSKTVIQTLHVSTYEQYTGTQYICALRWIFHTSVHAWKSSLEKRRSSKTNTEMLCTSHWRIITPLHKICWKHSIVHVHCTNLHLPRFGHLERAKANARKIRKWRRRVVNKARLTFKLDLLLTKE